MHFTLLRPPEKQDGTPINASAYLDSSAHYTPPRLRATVAMIIMLPEFHQR